MKTKRLIFRLFLLIAIAALVEWFVYAKNDVQTNVMVEQPQAHQAAPTLQVTHTLTQDDLELKLAVTNFTFSLENMGKENKQGEGHVHLYLDGKKIAKVFEASYVLKDIPSGKHEITVELAHNNHESYGVSERFNIEVKP
ncbi:hypothetical protein AV540_23330 [Brevibacillus parabrevis]|uniref:hypothetical protein n=1 Tax=Brevibacillus parabrevis TaxID=54914 RepID=UPI0007ABD680|nr:hypothetical protein [Brevibacillus parabrevis]KZE44803.1 hypothetical protein AV540_23330 [Brevibacillus parabrevis]